MYYVGIDIAKFKHDCCILSDNLVEVTQFSFKNNAKGYEEFFTTLRSLDFSENFKIGLEATGHYGNNLKMHLSRNGYSYMELNPLLISRFIKSRTLRKTKTDKIDSKEIAMWVATAEYKPSPAPMVDMVALKSLTRFRDALVKERSKQLVRITNVLDHIFPEFKGFFNNDLRATPLFILENFSNAEKISNITPDDMQRIYDISHGKIDNIRVSKLIELAKNTIGKTEDYLEKQMILSINIFKDLDKQIDTLEEEIKGMMKILNPKCLTIPGIGTTTAAVICAEYGDISKFNSASQMIAFAGLDSGFYQSGEAEHSGKMVKRGSPYLRNALIFSANSLRIFNPVFAVYYAKKKREGKHHTVCCVHVAKKLVRVIFTLEKNNINFDPNKLI